MARSTKAAVLEETVEETEVAEPTNKQIVNDGIVRVIEAHGIDVQKNRYKAMRAIAWQAFVNAIEDGTFDALVDEAIANVDELPTGWEIEKPEREAEVKAAPAKKAPAKKAPAKAPAKTAAKTATKAAPRKRPTR
ncbi:hypothetical protein SEA_FINNY_40 [Microbacterium phage Finny]|uniref:Uncharacterized protein n=1 Tax=Microbacterium phage Finny TaxID=2590878 RepID=A0A4Y6EAR5_9CAUD|nr:hypothetical protein SEA_FINNY_40 [Microbacterium phage Finny]